MALPVLFGAILVSACGADGAAGGGPAGGGPAVPAAPARTATIDPTGAPSTSGQVAAAWLSAEEAFANAALTSDPDQPDLLATMVAPQLPWSRSLLAQMRSAGQVAKGPVLYGTPAVTILGGGRATVRACVHDEEVVVWAATGQPVPGEPGRVDYELFESTMELTGSGWKLLTQRIGVDQCDRL